MCKEMCCAGKVKDYNNWVEPAFIVICHFCGRRFEENPDNLLLVRCPHCERLSTLSEQKRKQSEVYCLLMAIFSVIVGSFMIIIYAALARGITPTELISFSAIFIITSMIYIVKSICWANMPVSRSFFEQ